MATPAQIEANRRNARKSTGPRTAAGKAASSRNAVTHGLTASIGDAEVRAYYELITEAPLPDGTGVGDVQSDFRALQLAKAEARLARARRGEAQALSEGDSAARFLPEIDQVNDRLAEDVEVWKEFTLRDLLYAARLKTRLARSGAQFTVKIYRSQRRYLQEAERQHAAALRNFVKDHP
jgi:hypothetical protein